MSQLDVEIVRSIYDAFESHDTDTLLHLLDEDIVAVVGDDLPWSGTYHGREGFLELLRRIDAAIHVNFESDEFIDAGSDVAQVGTGVADVLVSGKHFTFREIHIWSLRNGLVAEFRNYSDTTEQRRALGLSMAG